MSLDPSLLVPVKIDFHDERGWTDDESATSDSMRKSWDTVAGQSYCRVQNVGGVTKIFAATTEDIVGVQSVVRKDANGVFPSIFYYKVS